MRETLNSPFPYPAVRCNPVTSKWPSLVFSLVPWCQRFPTVWTRYAARMCHSILWLLAWINKRSCLTENAPCVHGLVMSFLFQDRDAAKGSRRSSSSILRTIAVRFLMLQYSPFPLLGASSVFLVIFQVPATPETDIQRVLPFQLTDAVMDPVWSLDSELGSPWDKNGRPPPLPPPPRRRQSFNSPQLPRSSNSTDPNLPRPGEDLWEQAGRKKHLRTPPGFKHEQLFSSQVSDGSPSQ